MRARSGLIPQASSSATICARTFSEATFILGPASFFSPYVRALDDLGPLRRLGAHRRAEFLGRVADHVGAQVGDLFLQVGGFEHSGYVVLYLQKNFTWSGRWNNQAKPVGKSVAGNA